MRKIIVSAVGLLALSPLAVHAVPIVNTATCIDSTNECATGISGLEILGDTLDVSFVTGTSFNALYGASDPYFLGDDIGGVAARDAIIAAFGIDIYGVVGEGLGNQTSRFLIPSLVTGPGHNGGIGYSGRDSAAWVATSYGASNSVDFSDFEPDFYTAYAVFRESVTTVPEPGTLALMLSGLVIGGLARRRRKTA